MTILEDKTCRAIIRIADELGSPDYYTRLKDIYAGLAMGAILSNESFLLNMCKNDPGMPIDENIARTASEIANALVEKQKEEK